MFSGLTVRRETVETTMTVFVDAVLCNELFEAAPD
jgi:hypothetical protein